MDSVPSGLHFVGDWDCHSRSCRRFLADVLGCCSSFHPTGVVVYRSRASA
ncbi:hypothetical protein HMPREF0281_00849 [Corynebacterium ammoniagenes DSM 20306]|uniref:Uncharacterized protein n=1 Tax=Corynebacterium ammoniagenes DSM 20306 TaxID=649754 RepID=A0ABP2IGS6_CORAM|nr:hypothetical protein HMPREF0281_00849 [Corynebacterium ammoniagenes DSM 20306]